MKWASKATARWTLGTAIVLLLTACGGGGGGGGGVSVASLSASESTITLGTSVTLTPNFRLGTATLSPNPNSATVASGVGIRVTPEITTTYQLTVSYTDPNSQQVVTNTVETTITVTEATDTLISAGNMLVPRSGAAYAVINNPVGAVLACGGQSSAAVILNTCEIFEPVSESWRATGPMKAARRGHTLTALPNGKVLVVGGTDGKTQLGTAELFDPATGLWTAVTSVLLVGRSGHTATLMDNGSVLIAGGEHLSGAGTSTATFDPSTLVFTNTSGGMSRARVNHTATLLPSGKVLVAGKNPVAGFESDAKTAELYDPEEDEWFPVANMGANRFGHSATLMADGNVLVLGGFGFGTDSTTGEIYRPGADNSDPGSWTPLSFQMSTSRALHTATALPDGRVLVLGGYYANQSIDSSDIFVSAGERFRSSLKLKLARAGHSAVLLPNGKVLVFGAYAPSGVFSNTSEIFWDTDQ